MAKTKLFIPLLSFVIYFGCNQPAENVSETNPLSKMNDSLIQGWNTWNNPSLLSMVKMPEGLNMQLVFRKQRGGPYWLKDCYITGEHIDFPEKVTPIAHAYDGSYIEFELEWEGMKAHIRSAYTDDAFVYYFRPLENPDNLHVMNLLVSYLWNMDGSVSKQDSIIVAENEQSTYTIRSTASPVEVNLPLNAPYLSFWSDTETGFYTGVQKSLDDVKTILDEQKEKHENHLRSYGVHKETYHAMQAVNSWNIIYDAKNRRAIAPVSRVWNETWGGYVIFDWDTYFTGAMLALDNKYLGYSNCIAMSNAITEAGFVPNLESFFNINTFDRSQPPVGSIVCKLIYDKYKDDWFLEEVYDELLSWNRWWARERDNEGYLSWGSDPHPRGLSPNTKQAAKWESGLDNSPLFDDAEFNPEINMLELASAGLMGLYLADCKNLIEIAEALNRQEDVEEIKQRQKKYAGALENLWDEETGIYRDKYTTTGEFSTHLAPTNFYPLISGIPTQQQAERMIEEHFFNPDEFYGEWMIPSIARNDPAFHDNSYWRGRIWAPMNFLVYLGLRNYDLPEARKTLVEKSEKLILKEWTEERRVYENYNSMTGEGGDVHNSDSFYSWGGLLSFIVLMEEGYW